MRKLCSGRDTRTRHVNVHFPRILEVGPNQAWNVSHYSAGRGEIASASLEIGIQKSSIWSDTSWPMQRTRHANDVQTIFQDTPLKLLHLGSAAV